MLVVFYMCTFLIFCWYGITYFLCFLGCSYTPGWRFSSNIFCKGGFVDRCCWIWIFLKYPFPHLSWLGMLLGMVVWVVVFRGNKDILDSGFCWEVMWYSNRSAILCYLAFFPCHFEYFIYSIDFVFWLLCDRRIFWSSLIDVLYASCMFIGIRKVFFYDVVENIFWLL